MPQVRKSLEQFRPIFITMKKFLLTFVAFVSAVVSYAQQQLVATLTHGEEVSMFYGAYAYRDAMAAAVDGDVINLSGGGFQACTIDKAVSIRGAGVLAEMPTFIINDFDINVPAESTERLSIEGVNFPNRITLRNTLTNAYFLKNYMADVWGSDNANIKNAMFVNCQVYYYDVNQFNETVSSQFVNSYVNDIHNEVNSKATAAYVNCVIRPAYDGYYADWIAYSVLVNCILVGNNPSQSLPATSTAINCLAVFKRSHNAFRDVAASVNNRYINDFAIFTDSDYMKDLTDEAKATYLGSDGTPVGMYGGTLPFSFTPTYPQITKMNVASKTTVDGKLSVDIEVSAAQ